MCARRIVYGSNELIVSDNDLSVSEIHRSMAEIFPEIIDAAPVLHGDTLYFKDRDSLLERRISSWYEQWGEIPPHRIDPDRVDIGSTYAKKGNYEAFVGQTAKVIFTQEELGCRLLEVVHEYERDGLTLSAKKQIVVREEDCIATEIKF